MTEKKEYSILWFLAVSGEMSLDMTAKAREAAARLDVTLYSEKDENGAESDSWPLFFTTLDDCAKVAQALSAIYTNSDFMPVPFSAKSEENIVKETPWFYPRCVRRGHIPRDPISIKTEEDFTKVFGQKVGMDTAETPMLTDDVINRVDETPPLFVNRVNTPANVNPPSYAIQPSHYRVAEKDGGFEPRMIYPIYNCAMSVALNEHGYLADPEDWNRLMHGNIPIGACILPTRTAAAAAISKAMTINGHKSTVIDAPIVVESGKNKSHINPIKWTWHNRERLVKLFYEYEELNSAWGSLHVAMADRNLDRDSLVWCRDYAIKAQDYAGAFLADLLLQLRNGDLATMKNNRDYTIDDAVIDMLQARRPKD